MRKRNPMPRRLMSARPSSGWTSPRQLGPTMAPAKTKNTTSGTGRPGMRLARNEHPRTRAMMTASMQRFSTKVSPS